MGWLIRTLLIWLLMLAVPAQGAAAATMAFCGPDHHGGGSTSTTLSHDKAAARAHSSDAPPNGHSHHDTSVQADGGASVDSASPSAAKTGQAEQKKCSACASCCSAGAILNATLEIFAPAAAATVFDALVPTVDTFAVGGPDRPPRHVLA